MKDKTKTENIANGIVLSLHIFDVDDFRSYIPWGSTPNKEIFIGVCELS